jgi:hypothetical protein
MQLFLAGLGLGLSPSVRFDCPFIGASISLIRVNVTDSEGLVRRICRFDFVYESCFSNVCRHVRKISKSVS